MTPSRNHTLPHVRGDKLGASRLSIVVISDKQPFTISPGLLDSYVGVP